MTSVGDVEAVIVIRVAVRGRLRDLAAFFRELGDAECVVIMLVRQTNSSKERNGTDLKISMGSQES